MTNISDSEIHEIVQRVVDHALGTPVREPASIAPASIQTQASSKKVVAIGADHGGYELKEALKPELKTLGFDIQDVGTNSKEAVDY
ncbi:MAG TPA: RpiB/LacA/LacB family sugar-phosphate isomerase, partial [Anaerolineales bacterium]